jgi:hypothetical protein
VPPADAHEFAVENAASQRKFGAGNALNSVSIKDKCALQSDYGQECRSKEI